MISVIVPIYNGSRFLENFFNSLLSQKLDCKEFEIVMVDNNSTDNTSELIKEFISKNEHINLKYIFYDKRASSYASRNIGVKNSRGEILAFTDSDCILENDWLENIKIKLTEKEKIISGKIELYFDDKRNIWENFDKIVHMRNDERINKNEVATANMAINKTLFNKIGFFDEVSSGGDFNFAKRAVKQGFEIEFIEEIKVLHPTRKTYNEIRKKLLRLTFGEGELYKKHNRSFLKGIAVNILRVFNLPKHLKISSTMLPNVGIINVTKFNIIYFYLKVLQLNSFIRGYRSDG